MTPQPNQLWALQGQIFELLEAREDALSLVQTAIQWCGKQAIDDIDGDAGVINARAELAAIETAIGNFVSTKIAEVSEVRASYFALIDAAAIAKAEANRASNRAMVLQNRADKLKDLIQSCMETLGRNRFDSAMGYFSIKGNGGKQPVEITNEALVPDEMCKMTGSMPMFIWKAIRAALVSASDHGHFRSANALGDMDRCVGMKREVSKTAISEALAQHCERCNGNGVVDPWGDPDEDADYRAGEDPCKGCGGSGKRGVPGARLAERGKSLVIK